MLGHLGEKYEDGRKKEKNIDGLILRNLRVDEIDQAERLVRIAFGTFLGFPDPSANPSKRQMILHRFNQDPRNVLAAMLNGELVGTNILSKWGSFAFFGPLTVRPDLWDAGIGTILVRKAVEHFAAQGVRNLGLFTFSNSPKHLGLYHKFGFCSRFLTPIMELPVDQMGSNSIDGCKMFSNLNESEKQNALGSICELTDELYPGLEVSSEIRLTDEFKLGDTLLIKSDDTSDNLAGFAVCQSGAKTEAGLDRCYVKFAAVRPGCAKDFERLLTACQSYAAVKGVEAVEAGINLSHDKGFDIMLKIGFRVDFIGVAMQKPNEPAHCRPENFVIDDWR